MSVLMASGHTAMPRDETSSTGRVPQKPPGQQAATPLAVHVSSHVRRQRMHTLNLHECQNSAFDHTRTHTHTHMQTYMHTPLARTHKFTNTHLHRWHTRTRKTSRVHKCTSSQEATLALIGQTEASIQQASSSLLEASILVQDT